MNIYCFYRPFEGNLGEKEREVASARNGRTDFNPRRKPEIGHRQSQKRWTRFYRWKQ